MDHTFANQFGPRHGSGLGHAKRGATLAVLSASLMPTFLPLQPREPATKDVVMSSLSQNLPRCLAVQRVFHFLYPFGLLHVRLDYISHQTARWAWRPRRAGHGAVAAYLGLAAA